MTGREDEPPETPSDEGPDPYYVLRLYVTGSTPRSTRAIENLRDICGAELKGRYELKVIDIYQNPDSAQAGQIVAAPTLVRVRPEPVRRIVGDLSDRERVLTGLELRPRQDGSEN